MKQQEREHKQGLESWKKMLTDRKNRLVLIGLAGICLIFLSDLFGGRPDAPKVNEKTQFENPSIDVCEIEQKLTGMLECVEGVGKVHVMITLESSPETIYALNEQKDTKTSRHAEQEQPEQADSYKSEHIFMDSPQGKRPLVETYLEPEIRGAAIVCEGGDDITVIKRITDLVSAVLGLATNRICVTKMI